MEDERLDLSPLDPTRDAVRWERLIRSVTDRAAPELARRAARRSLAGTVAAWARPTLAAAAALVLLAFAVARSGSPAPQPGALDSAVIAGAEGLRLPAPAVGWLLEEEPPPVSELILAAEDDLR